MTFRPILAPLAGAAICMAMMTQAPSAAVGEAVIAHFAAKAVSVQDESYAGRIDILLERWSTDEELRDAKDVLAKQGAGALLPLFQKSRGRVGVVLMPGVQGTGARARMRRPRNLLFAREVETKTGRQVVVIADQHLGIGQFERWGPSSEEELTLVDLRIAADGTGIGKIAGPSGVAYNSKTRMIEAASYDKQPVRLSEVRSEKP